MPGPMLGQEGFTFKETAALNPLSTTQPHFGFVRCPFQKRFACHGQPRKHVGFMVLERRGSPKQQGLGLGIQAKLPP